MRENVELSVVVPVYNEAGNVAVLAGEIAQALNGRAYEMIFVDDASTDATRAELAAARAEMPRLRIVAHRRNAGQSRAVRSGVFAARAPVVTTLDGDGQNDPADLSKLVAQLTRNSAAPGLALVQGQRIKRQDTFAKRFASRFANGVRKRILADGAEDSGCGIKAFHREAFLRLPYFDHMHRYMAALMLREGFAVEFCPVNHRPRRAGRSKYNNLERLAASLTDLYGVVWLKSRARVSGGADEL